MKNTILGSVTLVKSNAKALLTAAPSKMQPVPGFALSEGDESTGVGLGLCPVVCGQLPAELPFEKGTLHSAQTLSVTVRVDGDGVLVTAPTP